MREGLRTHGPAWTGFFAMIAIALLMGNTIQAGLAIQAPRITALPGPPIDLPTEDADGDSYGDDVDLFDGDLALRIEFTELTIPGTAPYIVVGTQDDQWRLGEGAELEWPHIIDHDPLGRTPGSAAWKDDVLRTGAWWYSVPADGASKAIVGASRLNELSGDHGFLWPQAFHVDVREDRPLVALQVYLYDAGPDPDREYGPWEVEYDVLADRWRVEDGPWLNDTHEVEAVDGDASLVFNLRLAPGITPAVAQVLAEKWAPTLYFAGGERFFPVPGDLMQEFHGFADVNPDYRTWTRGFNNGRDAYMLFLGDFNGDRKTDHQDAAIMVDVLAAGGRAPPTVYAHVHQTTGDRLVIQYWFLYAYNFVPDESGDDIALLAHNGDREFIQVTFENLAGALAGEPIAVSYSEHYKGIRVEDPESTDVYVAKGSHASYPGPGDDRKLRPAFVGYGDVFDGQGPTWDPGNYTIELLKAQEFHQGYLWGPITRHSRELGTTWKPLQQHTFRYPFIDPMVWQHGLREVKPGDFDDLFGGA